MKRQPVKTTLLVSFCFYRIAFKIKKKKALFNLGLCYKLGKICEKNPAKAFECFSKGASLGNSKGIIFKILFIIFIKAMYELALKYEEGVVCQKNYQKAFELYEKAASLKNPLGKH